MTRPLGDPYKKGQVSPVETLATEIKTAVDSGLYYLALIAALSLPDMCAAAESTTGTTSGSRYRKWWSQWVGDDRLPAADAYKLRCAVVHQGRIDHGNLSVARILFSTPESKIQFDGIAFEHERGDIYLELVDRFVHRVVAGALTWNAARSTEPHVAGNLDRFMGPQEGAWPIADFGTFFG